MFQMLARFQPRKPSAPTEGKANNSEALPVGNTSQLLSNECQNHNDARCVIDRMSSPVQSHRSDMQKQAIEQSKYPNQKSTSKGLITDSESTATVLRPSRLEIMRYRAHHGVNLGSCFVLEKWLTPFAFPHDVSSSQTSELAAVSLSVAEIGIDATKSNFENRWQSFMHSSDFDWLVSNAQCTSLRLPIGYWDLGSDFVSGTPFEQYAPVYANAWSSIKSICNRASTRGIGVLLDFHALPGGANKADHSGTNSGVADLWANKTNLDLAQRCLEFIAYQALSMDNIVGIELCNEADMDAPGMYDWYDAVHKSISMIDPTMPLLISDGWNLAQAIDYSLKKNSVDTELACPIVVDTHKYYCFAAQDAQMTPQAIISKIPSELNILNDKAGSIASRGAVQVIVGEYSCVLSDSTWSQKGNIAKSDLVKNFGNIQCSSWQQKAGGSYFWTYKMDWMPGGEWGFVNVTNIRAIVSPDHLTLPISEVRNRLKTAQSGFKDLFAIASQNHQEYWKNHAPETMIEPWRFDLGYKTGFEDARHFFEARLTGAGVGMQGGDRIGCLEIWILKRIRDCSQSGKFLWEFEQGFRNGVQDFQTIAGIKI